jgi:Protein of unknown function (DUF3768)
MSTQRIRELNDVLRRTFAGGQIVMTAGVNALPDDERRAVFRTVASFEDFTSDNDPRGEHDFGNFTLAGRKFFWKIDAYNADMTGGSENPADPSKTTRVLTIMLASEY